MGRFRQLGYRVKMATRERIAATKTAQAAPTDYLFWPRDVSHAKFMIPVAQAVGRRGQPWRMVTCQARQFERLRRLVPDPVFALGAWPQVVREARRDGTSRARQLARLAPWRLDDLLGRADLAAVAQRAVVQFLPLAAEAIANARAALDAFRPKLLVVGNDLTLEGRAASRVAAQRGVPTATFMHGSISGNAMQRLHCVDRMLVYSKSHRQTLARQGFADERIVVCGAPYLDQRPRQTGQIHPALQARLGLRSGEPWILVATSGPGHSVSHQHHQKVIDAIVRLSESLPQVPVVVKLHRKDHPSYYQAALRDHPAGKLAIVRADAQGFPADIFEWLNGCSVVLTGASTVAIEAMLMEVPVVTMDFCDELHDIDFIDAGATIHVATGKALTAKVGEILAARTPGQDVKSRVQSFLEDAFFALDGRSADRAAQALGELIETRAGQ